MPAAHVASPSLRRREQRKAPTSILGGVRVVGMPIRAAATSLPELAVTLAALRLSALDLAIGSRPGNNLFNIVVMARRRKGDGLGRRCDRRAGTTARNARPRRRSSDPTGPPSIVRSTPFAARASMTRCRHALLLHLTRDKP